MRKFVSASVFLGITLTSAAWAKPEKPVCPSVAEIQNTQFVGAGIQDGKFAVIQFSNYGTNELWGFGIYNIDASSPSDAIAQAQAALPNLTFKNGPLRANKINTWGCNYNIGEGFKAVALTASTDKFLQMLSSFE